MLRDGVMAKTRYVNITALFSFFDFIIAGKMYVEIPMINPKEISKGYRASNDIEEHTIDDTWHWWNKFRTFVDYNLRIRVCIMTMNSWHPNLFSPSIDMKIFFLLS